MAVNYRMRGFDTTLTRLVFWTATIIDTGGAQYTGPGPLTDVVIQDEFGGGSDGANNVLTWRPGSSDTGPVVFSSFTALYGQLDTLRTTADDSGEFVIVFDDQITTLNVPVGTFDMDRTAWHGIPRDDITGFVPVPLQAGVVINNLQRINNLTVVGNATGPSIELTIGQTLTLLRATLKSTGFAPLVHLGGRASIHLDDLSSIVNTGDGSVSGVVSVDGGVICDVLMDGADSSIDFGSFSGGVSAQLAILIGSSSASLSRTQNHFSGTISVSQRVASWRSAGSPNGSISSDKGANYSDTDPGFTWRNVDSGTTWVRSDSVFIQQSGLTVPPFHSLAIHPDGSKIYVGNELSTSTPLYVLSTVDGSLITTIPTGLDSSFVTITPDGSKVYVSSYYDQQVTVIDTSTDTVLTAIPIGNSVQELTPLPDGTEIWVTVFAVPGQIVRIDTSTDTIVGSPIILTGGLAQYITIRPDGAKAYVSCAAGPSQVSVVTVASHTETAVVSSNAPRGIVATHNNLYVYFADAFLGSVVKFDATTSSVISTPALTGFSGPLYVDIDPVDGAGYIVENYVGLVQKFDVASDTLIGGTISVGLSPAMIHVDSAGIYAYTPNEGSNTVSQILLSDDSVTAFHPDTAPFGGPFRTFNMSGYRLVDEGAGIVDIGVAVVFDNIDPEIFTNIRSDRDQQSPIDNSKTGITNLGSSDGTYNDSTNGVQETYGTVGGGDDNGVDANTVGGTIAGGLGNFASGEGYSTVGGGLLNQVHGLGSTVAGGEENNAQADYGTVGGGFSNAAEGYAATIVGGYNNGAPGQYSGTLGGRDNFAFGAYSAVLAGQGNNTNGDHAVVMGFNCQASGESSIASGSSSHAYGYMSRAQGTSIAFRPGQVSFNGPNFVYSWNVGEAQTSYVTMFGETPGSAPGESVDLMYGFTEPFQLEASTAYTFVVTITARSNTADGFVQSFKQMLTVNVTDGNVASIVAFGAAEQIGDVGSASWTFVMSVTVDPYFVITFNTGTTTTATRVIAKIEFVEVALLP